jgi:hypothetical protein
MTTRVFSSRRLAVLILMFPWAVYSQGTVAFVNDPSTRVYLESGDPVPVGNTFSAELMAAPDGTANFDAMAVRVGAPVFFGGSSGTSPGIFNGGARTALNITPAGGFGLFQVRVWETAFGTSYADVVASGNLQARVGKSNIVRVNTADPFLGTPETPSSLVQAGLTSFSVTPVPEPSILLLAAIALIGYQLASRRK